jgi:ribosomal protein S18 acetylase RimI-like enzyme
MSAHRDLTRGDGRLRIAPWRGDITTAYLTPARGRPTVASVERSLDHLEQDGFGAALTAALAPAEQEPFLHAGFEVHERLHLLTRSLDDLPPLSATPAAALRRGRRADRPGLLRVDAAAFPPFWRLDEAALDDAIAATPSARVRVAAGGAVTGADGGPGGLAGYAITGRSGPRGYLQRLAVDPSRQRHGIGRGLVIDGLRWLRRWRAREVLVNTQVGNEAALALYRSLGFRLDREGLAVLRREIRGVSS